MIRFMSDTRYAGLEKEMQHIPGFRPRRSGMVISHLSGCLENQRSPCERRVTIVSRFMSFWRCWQRKWLSAPL